MINKLRRIVENNCISRDSEINTLDYWSNIVFARCVFILVPLSILVVIPGIIISVQNQLYPILWLNLFCLSVIIIVGYVPGIAVKIRKLSLIFLVFLAVFFLLKELGNLGPGLAYLLSITVISLLLFPGKQTSLPFIFTLLFCVFYGLLIHYGYVEIQSIKNNQLMEWIAVSSNVVFMSAIFSLLIPFFLSKLEETLSEKMLLLDSVSKMNIELERSIAEIKSKNSELEQFAFIASHDMQEPLRMITSFMDKLKLKLGDQLDDKANQYIYYATDAAKRMRQIILDLLDYLRAGKPTEPMVKVDLNDVLQEYKELRRDIIIENTATISAIDLPVVYSYKASIATVFHSLLDNAIKYSREEVNPEIEVSVIESEDEWKFAVKDNGIGISSEFYDKIFITFQQLHNRNEFDGTGIGLSIAKKQVEFLGGKIWVESTIGEGSTFYFTLPKTKPSTV